jgi:hypothetical protein
MSASSSRPRSAAFRRPGYASSSLRISDADRAEVADLLSKHYADGRLEQAEFNDRVDQAMRAKTRADLTGLFADLPDLDEQPVAVGERASGPQQQQHHILMVVLVIVVAVVGAKILMAAFVPWWLLVGLLAFLVLHYGPPHRRR